MTIHHLHDNAAAKADAATESSQPDAAPHDNQIVAERRAKLAALRAATNDHAFPNDFQRLHMADALHAAHGDQSKESLEAIASSSDAAQVASITVAVAGRMMLKRVMGKASFATLQDMSGRIQVYLSVELRIPGLGGGCQRVRKLKPAIAATNHPIGIKGRTVTAVEATGTRGVVG